MLSNSKIQILVFILALTVDVRVRAKPIEEPHKCLQAAADCAMFAKASIEDFKTENARIYFSKNTSLIRNADQSITLVRGLARLASQKSTRLQNQYGDLVVVDGEVLVEASDSIFKFTNLSAQLLYRPRGEKQYHKLPVGYSTYFSFMTKSGVADTGFPRPAEIEVLLKKWGEVVYRSEQKKFEKDLDDFYIYWSAAVRTVDEWYVDTVQREIASLRAEEARQARLKAAREAEDMKYKQMFRSRIFNQW